MIKFKLRRNLIYPGQYVIWSVVRDFLSIMSRHYLYFSNSLVYGPIMFLGEFIAGLIFYLYYKKIQIKSNKVKSSFVYNIGFMRSKKEAVIDFFKHRVIKV